MKNKISIFIVIMFVDCCSILSSLFFVGKNVSDFSDSGKLENHAVSSSDQYIVNYDFNGVSDGLSNVSLDKNFEKRAFGFGIVDGCNFINSEGVYEVNEKFFVSQNDGIDDSFSYGQINFYVQTDFPQWVTFQCINSGEQGCDFGIMSELDCFLNTNNDFEEGYRNFSEESEPIATYVSYLVEGVGEHFVTFKYIKDSSGSYNDDKFFVRLVGGVDAEGLHD